MIGFSGYRSNFIILLAIIFQLLNTHCSRKFNPSSSVSETGVVSDSAFLAGRNKTRKIEVHSKEKLQDFRSNDSLSVIGASTTIAEDIIRTAMSYLGIPHCMGGLTRKCIDCSGLVLKVFEEHGISLPRSAQDQSGLGRTVSEKKDLEKGDIVFFKGSYKTSRNITHSGIYIGENKFIHTSSGKGVTITSLDDSYWKMKFVFGKRFL